MTLRSSPLTRTAVDPVGSPPGDTLPGLSPHPRGGAVATEDLAWGTLETNWVPGATLQDAASYLTPLSFLICEAGLIEHLLQRIYV